MIAFAACALIVGTGYAAWTYVGADPEARSAEASVGEFKYPGWYDIVDGKEKFNNDLGFLVRGATYDATTHALLTLPSDASSGLSICGLRNYNSCPVVYFPSAIADPNNPSVFYSVTSFESEYTGNGYSRGQWSLFGTISWTSDYKTYSFTDDDGANQTAIRKIRFALPGLTNNSLTYIGTRSFADMSGCTDISLDRCSALQYIDEWAFCRIPTLTSFKLPSGFTCTPAMEKTTGSNIALAQSLGHFSTSKGNMFGMLHHCDALTSFDFDDYSNITAIPANMFRDCVGLTNLRIPSRIEMIYTKGSNTNRNTAFGASDLNGLKGQMSLANVYYGGTAAQFAAKVASSSNAARYDADLFANYTGFPAFQTNGSYDDTKGVVHCLTKVNGNYQYIKMSNLTNKNGTGIVDDPTFVEPDFSTW